MANGNLEITSTVANWSGRIHDVKAMIACGTELGTKITSPCVITLSGPLGAGKTHFVKGLARGLGSVAPVSSPTFTLVHEINDGRLPLIHFDFYRLSTPDELDAVGWYDYLNSDSVVVVEWGEKFPEVMPPFTIRITIAITGDARELSIASWEAGR